MSDEGRYLDWDHQDLRDYFSLTPSRHVGCYWRGEPFCPHGLGERSPSQMHETHRHKGVYVQLDGLGCPEQKASVIAWLDGVRFTVMHAAVSCLIECKPDAWHTFSAMGRKQRIQTWEIMAEKLSIDQSTIKRRCDSAIEAIDDFLNAMLKINLKDVS